MPEAQKRSGKIVPPRPQACERFFIYSHLPAVHAAEDRLASESAGKPKTSPAGGDLEMIEIEPRASGVKWHSHHSRSAPSIPHQNMPRHAGGVFLLHDQVCLPAAELPGKQNFKMDGPSVPGRPLQDCGAASLWN